MSDIRESTNLPSPAEMAEAAAIVDSDAVIPAYGAVEWDCLHEDGKAWIALIVREAKKRALATTPPTSGDSSVERLREAAITESQWAAVRAAVAKAAWQRPAATCAAMAAIKAALSPAVPSGAGEKDGIPAAVVLERFRPLVERASPVKLRALGGYLGCKVNAQTIFHLDEIGQEHPAAPFQAVPFARSADAELIAALWNFAHDLFAASPAYTPKAPALNSADGGASNQSAEVERLRAALRAVRDVRVSGSDNIWAGRDRCRAIADAALSEAQ